MHTKFSRQVWAYDPNYTRVEALDEAGQPLGYVYFEPRTMRRCESSSSLLSTIPQVCRQLLLNLFVGLAS